MMYQKTIMAMAKGMLALIEHHLKSEDMGAFSPVMRDVHHDLINALGDTDPHDCQISKEENTRRVQKEMATMQVEYPYGRVVAIARINAFEDVAFLYPKDERQKGIAVLGDFVRLHKCEPGGYFVMSKSGMIGWLGKDSSIRL